MPARGPVKIYANRGAVAVGPWKISKSLRIRRNRPNANIFWSGPVGPGARQVSGMACERKREQSGERERSNERGEIKDRRYWCLNGANLRSRQFSSRPGIRCAALFRLNVASAYLLVSLLCPETRFDRALGYEAIRNVLANFVFPRSSWEGEV